MGSRKLKVYKGGRETRGTGGLGDEETRRQGDKETKRLGDWETEIWSLEFVI